MKILAHPLYFGILLKAGFNYKEAVLKLFFDSLSLFVEAVWNLSRPLHGGVSHLIWRFGRFFLIGIEIAGCRSRLLFLFL